MALRFCSGRLTYYINRALLNTRSFTQKGRGYTTQTRTFDNHTGRIRTCLHHSSKRFCFQLRLRHARPVRTICPMKKVPRTRPTTSEVP